MANRPKGDVSKEKKREEKRVVGESFDHSPFDRVQVNGRGHNKPGFYPSRPQKKNEH